MMGRYLGWIGALALLVGLSATTASAQVRVGVHTRDLGVSVAIGAPRVHVVERYHRPYYRPVPVYRPAPVYRPVPVRGYVYERDRYERGRYDRDREKREREYRRDLREARREYERDIREARRDYARDIREARRDRRR